MNLENIDKKNIICINCGKKGHFSKKCIQPITSIGIICIQYENININTIIKYLKQLQNNISLSNNEIDDILRIRHILLENNTENNTKDNNFNESIKYLMIRRRNSLNYVEFIRGKYDLEDMEYLRNIANFLTIKEKEDILNYDFEYLWNNFWGDNYGINNNEYLDSKNKYEMLKNGFYFKKNEINIYINLDILFNDSENKYIEPEWGFPKGRRNLKEKNIECAKREFEEETNVNESLYHILNLSPIEEIFLASNNIKYKHIYYIAQSISDIDLKIDTNNKSQMIEISDLKWFSFKESYEKIRPYNIERKYILLNIHNIFKYIFQTFIKECEKII
jgi:8-oxo-dGTP pyrophosphatase MutT (NUDIX family)